MGNPIMFDYSVIFTIIAFAIIPLGIFALAAYLIVSITRFLKHKATYDKELLLKMDELIKLQHKSDEPS